MFAISLLLWVHEARASLAKPGCQDTCGNLTVPYPYGIRTGCFLHKSFEVSCNESSSHIVSPLRFVHNDKFEISEISMEFIRIVGEVPVRCNDSTNITSSYRFHLDPHFSYSHKRNVYIAMGCNISVSFLSRTPSHFKEAGCASFCNSTPSDGFFTCNGSNGCCQCSIPEEVNAYEAVILSAFGFSTKATCGHVFVAEKDFNLVTTLFGFRKNAYKIPVVLNWFIALRSCRQAQRKGNCLCGQNSQCIDSPKSIGYNCRCKNGYIGNPYLHNGCQGNVR